MSKNKWDSDYYKTLHAAKDCCDNCRYYFAGECECEFSEMYQESVEENQCCSHHWKVDSIN